MITFLLLLPSIALGAITIEPSGCGDDFIHDATGEEAYIQSPGYPGFYPDNMNCQWLISSNTGDSIDIRFEAPFHIEAGYGVCYDLLTIYRGADTNSGVLKELCGPYADASSGDEMIPPDPISHPASKFLVTFFSDDMGDFSGFKMYFKTDAPPPTTTTPGPDTTPGESTAPPQTTLPPAPTSPPSSTLPPEGDCGRPDISPWSNEERILNGEEADPHSFPWQVSITGALNVDTDHYCGASILSPSWVLTAAHCAEIVFIGDFVCDFAIIGMHDRRGGADDTDRQIIEIAAKFIHESHDNPDRANDVALLRLKSPAVLGKTVSPPCLPKQGDLGDDSSFPPGSPCLLSGWGKQGEGEGIPADEFGQPWRLRKGLMPLLSDSDCSRIYQEGADFTTQPTMECAGGCQNWPDTCQTEGSSGCNGDSGGPLVCQGEGGRWYQTGIVSFGPKPCDTEIPTVFTRVAGFRDWIEKTVEHNGGWD